VHTGLRCLKEKVNSIVKKKKEGEGADEVGCGVGKKLCMGSHEEVRAAASDGTNLVPFIIISQTHTQSLASDKSGWLKREGTLFTSRPATAIFLSVSTT
jgi:hypothetical protein